MDTKEALFYIIKKSVFGYEDGLSGLEECDLSDVYRLAKAHSLTHIVGFFAAGNGTAADDELLRTLKKDLNAAVLRDSKHDYVRGITFEILKKAGISFVPLKGAVIRELYPETWMRTSCDIDILVKEEELDKAVKVLTESGYETDGKRDFHDISVYFGGVHIELHFNICENISRVDQLLKEVWAYTENVDGSHYRETPEFFVFHHIAHMCYHFISGGCGIKPFIDLYLLKNSGSYDEEKLICLLEKCNIRVFYEKLCELMNVWFCGAEHNDITRTVEKYILEGGVYGTIENGSVVSSAYNKGKAANFLHIVFPDYQAMCNLYPTVKKHKITLPFFYLKRIFSKLTGKGSEVVFKMKTIAAQDGSNVESAREMLRSLGLD